MSKAEAKEILRRFNIWRRYDGPHDTTPTCPDPAEIGIAIDTLVNDELTWEDVKGIVEIADKSFYNWLYKEHHGPFASEEEMFEAYYSEVLKRFNESKKQ